MLNSGVDETINKKQKGLSLNKETEENQKLLRINETKSGKPERAQWAGGELRITMWLSGQQEICDDDQGLSWSLSGAHVHERADIRKTPGCALETRFTLRIAKRHLGQWGFCGISNVLTGSTGYTEQHKLNLRNSSGTQKERGQEWMTKVISLPQGETKHQQWLRTTKR